MFVKVRRVFTVGSILFLLALFTLPSLYLKTQCAALRELCDQVLLAKQADNAEAARAAYDSLSAQYERMRSRAELFLDHKVMDQATLPLQLMGVYLPEQDLPSLTAAATEFLQALDCILAIETEDPRLLL